MEEYTLVVTAESVTDEIVDIVCEIVDGWYQDSRIDWEDVIDRADNTELEDGTRIDFGGSMLSPAIRKVQRLVREYRKNN